MNSRTILNVPEGIKYISDWKEYRLPEGHCIIDKGVTGCGFTEFCLTNDQPLILCSPRRILLRNKKEQHSGENDRNIFYKDTKKDEKGDSSSRDDINNEEEEKEKFTYYQELENHLQYCLSSGKVCKFMVTYDSFHIVVRLLKNYGLLSGYQVVVDEFQAIFNDSMYKSEIENDFVSELQSINSDTGRPALRNVIYLSATPMLDKYLNKIEYFKHLDYYTIDWSKSGMVEKVSLEKHQVRSLNDTCIKIIQQYKAGRYPVEIDSSGRSWSSNEAVFYINSVTDIIRIVKKCELLPEEYNIICSDTEVNRNKLKSENMSIGRIPLETESNKMFTFCTSTAYIGTDFYSKCAKSYVFANPNLQCLATDIMLDLPQIAGRQRCSENIFKNLITIFYTLTKTTSLSNRQEFEKEQKRREELTRDILLNYEEISDSRRKELYVEQTRLSIKHKYLNRAFIGISKRDGTIVYNPFLKIAQERAWDVVQDDYLNSINVSRTINSSGKFYEKVYTGNSEQEKLVLDFIVRCFNTSKIFEKKLRMYCDFRDKFSRDSEIISVLNHYIQDPRFNQFYSFYGTDGCRAKAFRESNLMKGIYDDTKRDSLGDVIYRTFTVGEKYTMKEIKETLKNIYEYLGITKAPKAIDLNLYFEIKKTKKYIERVPIDAFVLLEKIDV